MCEYTRRLIKFLFYNSFFLRGSVFSVTLKKRRRAHRIARPGPFSERPKLGSLDHVRVRDVGQAPNDFICGSVRLQLLTSRHFCGKFLPFLRPLHHARNGPIKSFWFRTRFFGHWPVRLQSSGSWRACLGCAKEMS